MLVTAASVQDSVAGAHLFEQVAGDHPTIRKVWVDGGYRKHFVEHAATLGIDLEITQHIPGTRGFIPIPKRWAVERTYGWLMLHRRLARDYETLLTRSEAMTHVAMTGLMARRLTGENTTPGATPQRLTNRRFRGETTGENDLSASTPPLERSIGGLPTGPDRQSSTASPSVLPHKAPRDGGCRVRQLAQRRLRGDCMRQPRQRPLPMSQPLYSVQKPL